MNAFFRINEKAKTVFLLIKGYIYYRAYDIIINNYLK